MVAKLVKYFEGGLDYNDAINMSYPDFYNLYERACVIYQEEKDDLERGKIGG